MGAEEAVDSWAEETFEEEGWQAVEDRDRRNESPDLIGQIEARPD